MSFRNLNLPLSVKTTKDDPIQDFFNPVLSQSIEYCVAVGYFSSYWIRDAAEGIAKLASKGGKVRWVISPNLNSDDFEILSNSKSKDEKEEVFESISTRSFEELFEELSQNTRATLSWLIRDRIMDFRVGIPKNKLSGILHSKMGYFVDENGDEISFSGSYNLTNGANSNWERFDVFPEWKSEESSLRTDEIKYDFEAMWNKEDPNLDIYVPTSVVLKKYIMFTDDVDRPYPKPDVEPTHKIAIPEHFLSDGKLRPYQEEAIDKWFKNNGRGIFHMATGSGKTVTALVAAMRLTNHIIGNDGNISIVVAVPFQHLANQWEKEAKEFGFRTVKCFDSVVRWMPKAQKQIMNMLAGEEHYTFFITVNKTLFNDPFQNILSNLKGNILLIGDEMHNLGSSNYKKLLPENAKFRIGLSATPVRKGDEEGTESLLEYFSDPVIKFGIQEAIEHGYLCKYYYYPILSPFTDEEMSEYIDLSVLIAQSFGRSNENINDPNDYLKLLLFKRARLIGKAQMKITNLLSLLQDRKESTHNLVYCGDYIEEDEKQIEKAVRLIGTEVKMKVNKFTSEENSSDRKKLLDDFSKGDIQTLVAIRCLDEGVDVPKTESAYILASSSSPRQFIQRRGRVLRLSPGKKFASIYDFITIPDFDRISNNDQQAYNIERSLIKREIERVNEFAGIAINQGESLKTLREIRKRYNLMDF